MKHLLMNCFILLNFWGIAQSGVPKTLKGVFYVSFIPEKRDSVEGGYHFRDMRYKNLPIYPVKNMNRYLIEKYTKLEHKLGKPNTYGCHPYDIITDCNLLKNQYCILYEINDTFLYSPQLFIQKKEESSNHIIVAYNLFAKVIEYKIEDNGRFFNVKYPKHSPVQSPQKDTKQLDYLGTHFYVIHTIIKIKPLSQKQIMRKRLYPFYKKKIVVFPSEYLSNTFR